MGHCSFARRNRLEPRHDRTCSNAAAAAAEAAGPFLALGVASKSWSDFWWVGGCLVG
jgi:hypothetical protein